MERRLSAIFAADMVGYSRLMEADEVGTIERQKAHRNGLIDPTLERFGGRLVKEMGDGVLVEFPSVVDALRCAVEIQRAMPDREAGVPQNSRIEYRVGINLGDIVVDGNDIYGDGVNVAARLEQLAEPGSICVSGAAYDQLRSTVEVGYESLGEVQVKNIERPIRAYKVLTEPEQAGAIVEKSGQSAKIAYWAAAALVVLAALGATGWWWAQQRNPVSAGSGTVELPDSPSIAILPFDNMSGDSEQQYFVDGMVEDLITDLSKVPDLFVIARNSSFAYRGKDVDVQQVAGELGVRHVLEGSVRRVGDRVRINAQLIDGVTNAHVWAERYDGTLEDVFDLQDKFTAEIIGALKVVLGSSGTSELAARETRNPKAYDAFLRGMGYLSARSALDIDGNASAIESFEEALAFDPEYANAMAGIAWAKWLYHSSINYYAPGYKESAFEFAEKSLEFDDNALAHRVLARKYYAPPLHIVTKREPIQAVLELEAALALEPNNPDLLADLADVLPFAGQAERALETIRRAIRLNPGHPDWYLRPLGIALLLTGDAGSSAEALQRWLETETIMVDYTLWLAAALSLSGQEERARERMDYIRAGGGGGLPTTEYAVNRKWPLTGKNADIFHRGLRQAGFPEILRRNPISGSKPEQ